MILSPLPVQRFYSNLGLPLVGGKLFTYAAGTNTKIATYSDSGGTLNTNPVRMNFRGECNVWLDPTLTYKFVLSPSTDTDPPTNPIWTVDNIAGGLTINEMTQQFLGRILFPRTAAEIAAGVTPVDYGYQSGNILRYDNISTGDDATAAIQAALDVWSFGGPHPFIPEGTWEFSLITIPPGRGLIIAGEGPNCTKLVHNTSGSAVVLGADNIQLFMFRDIYIECSATTTVLLDFSGDFQAYNFRLENVELHEGASGNNSVVFYRIAGGATPGTTEKHYFSINGLKIFGGGTGIHLDGSTAAANDLTAVAFQIQGCADDGIHVEESSGNRFIGSTENCGDGASTFNLRIDGSTSGDNEYWGRLENTGSMSSQQVLSVSGTDTNNRIYSTLSATPTPANDLAISGGLVMTNGLEFSNIQRRMKGLTRLLGANTTDVMLSAALASDTMGGLGRFTLQASGRMGWADSTNPGAMAAELFYSLADTALRLSGSNLRLSGPLELADGITAPTNKSGVALLFVDSADGDLKITFSDGTTKTIVTD